MRTLNEILIAGHDQRTNYLIKNILKSEGYQTVSVSTSKDAYQKLSESPDALLILDYTMLDQLAKLLINNVNSKNISKCFVVLLSPGEEKYASQILKLGANDIILIDSSLEEIILIVINKIKKQQQSEIQLEQTHKNYLQSEELRLELESKYSELITNASNIIFTADMDGNFTTVNPVVQKILGYSIDEFTMLNYKNILTPETRSIAIKHLVLMSRSQELRASYEIDIFHKDGAVLTFDISSYVRHVNGIPKEIYGISSDITERKKLINELNRNYDVQQVVNSLLQLSLKDTPIDDLLHEAIKLIVNIPWLSFEKQGAIFLTTSDNNLKMSAEYGLPDKVKESCKNVAFGKCICGNVLATKKAMFGNKISHSQEIEIDGLNDHDHYCIPILFGDKVFGVINTYLVKEHVFSDFEADFLNSVANTLSGIIARKKAEKAAQELLDQLENRVKQRTEELSNTENLYLTTVNSFNDWVYVIDMDFNLVFLNQSLQNFFKNNGYQNGFIGRKLNKVFDFLKEETIKEIETAFITSEEIKSDAEYSAFGKNYYVQQIISPIIQEGKVIRIVVTVHDFTETKKAEEEIRKNLNKEKELNQLKSQFISTVSHEFRTPLAGILSSVQLLKRYGDKWDNDKKEKIYKQIFDAVYHTKSLLDDVSLINKEQSNKLYFKPDFIDLKPLINQIIEENLNIFGIDFHVNTTFNLSSETYYLDEVMIRHIFSNLLSNALKYSSENKDIMVSITEENNEKIKIIVEDQGIGIPDEDLKYLFEPFHRASNVENIKGTGFGMSIVKRFVDLHQGEIIIESTINKGTKITVILPCSLKK